MRMSKKAKSEVADTVMDSELADDNKVGHRMSFTEHSSYSE